MTKEFKGFLLLVITFLLAFLVACVLIPFLGVLAALAIIFFIPSLGWSWTLWKRVWLYVCKELDKPSEEEVDKP